MAARVSCKAATGIGVHFCDPHSPRQRGTNEDTNGLLRHNLLRSTDLATITANRRDWRPEASARVRDVGRRSRSVPRRRRDVVAVPYRPGPVPDPVRRAARRRLVPDPWRRGTRSRPEQRRPRAGRCDFRGLDCYGKLMLGRAAGGMADFRPPLPHHGSAGRPRPRASRHARTRSRIAWRPASRNSPKYTTRRDCLPNSSARTKRSRESYPAELALILPPSDRPGRRPRTTLSGTRPPALRAPRVRRVGGCRCGWW